MPSLFNNQPTLDEESVFARNLDGFLVRHEEPTEKGYESLVKIKIDDIEVEVPGAMPTRDQYGNILRDVQGRTKPRDTTIYDAVNWMVEKRLIAGNPIPTLCHQPHQRPIGVCRVCCVQMSRIKRGNLTPERRLVPACQHKVEADMVVHTWRSSNGTEAEKVKSAVRTVLELLVGDHKPPAYPAPPPTQQGQPPPADELSALATQFGVPFPPRWPRRPESESLKDPSSGLIGIDLNACILCNRCVRGCDDIKENFIIGRTGKGGNTRISFGMHEPMSESGCVNCGECLISCPTSALTLKGPIIETTGQSGQALDVQALRQLQVGDCYPFAALPEKFLEWNAHGVTRRRLQQDEVLFREGEYGHTAFIIVQGKLRSELRSAMRTVEKTSVPGFLSNLLGRISLTIRQEPTSSRSNSLALLSNSIRSDGARPLRASGTGFLPTLLSPDDLIIGEMTCLQSYPRASTVVADSQVVELLEIRRNVLLMMLREPSLRAAIRDKFRRHALQPYLLAMRMFATQDHSETTQYVGRLQKHVDFLQAKPGQVIIQEGCAVDAFYLIRLGFVKVSYRRNGQEIVVNYLGPNSSFGEQELLTQFAGERPNTAQPYSYTALDDVEVVRIRFEDFITALSASPALKNSLTDACRALLETPQEEMPPTKASVDLNTHLREGLYKAQSVLVLDLERCTRCDECTKACADTHAGVSRLFREGVRHDKYLIATSCRSCINPTCMVGCPVDAIHRTKNLNIKIEDWCIGCGHCSKNCPYEAIQMIDLPAGQVRHATRRAVTCDLCETVAPSGNPKNQPSCVYACPHDAAFRMKGEELQQRIEENVHR